MDKNTFMSLQIGTVLNTNLRSWKVIGEPVFSGDIPKILMQSSDEKLPRFVHLNEDGKFVDDSFNEISDLNLF